MYNLVELFSGIGSQAKAMNNLGMEIGDAYTCEWDIHAFVAYDAIHNSVELPAKIAIMSKEQILAELEGKCLSNNGKEAMQFKTLKTYSVEVLRKIYAAITRSNNFVDVSMLTGEKIPENIDILTYSFPCQDLSNVGAFHGYKKGIDKDSGSRSSLLWQVGRILKEMKDGSKSLPRYLLLENVPTLLSERHRDNFNTWINDLDDIGYISKYYQLNASSFGLPQNRPRLIMLSVYVGDDYDMEMFVRNNLFNKDEEDLVREYKDSGYYCDIKVSDLLRIDYDNETLRAEAIECTPNKTVSRDKIWKENPKIVDEDGQLNPKIDVIRTITTKQDRHPNSGNLHFDSGIDGRSTFRYLTPRECFLFMGFTDEDFDRVIADNPEVHKGKKLLPRDKLIRMAGNSIPVKLLEGVFLQIKNFDEMMAE